MIAGLVAVSQPVEAAGQAVELAPHRALYRLTLERAIPGSGISDATGELGVEWRHACGGWTFQYRSVIDIAYGGGKGLRLATSATTWEETGSRSFRFSVRHETNGAVTDRVEGHARLNKDGSGTVTYTLPKEKRLPLPRGTLFPVAHSLDVLQVARRGKPPIYHSRTVFDGMDAEGAYLVSAVIGRRSPAKDGPKALRGMATWPVHLAYFRDSRSPEPRFEMGMRMFDNGVTDDLVMALDEFTLRGRISKLELLPADCPG